MNSPATAASSTSGSIRSNTVDGMHTLRTELALTRASQLTLLRLQLALHKTNRRAAMQALDDLLDIDAEMEGLAAMLRGTATHPADDATLSGFDMALSRFIELQRAAIAAEKHALAGSDLRSDARSIAIPALDDRADDADLPAQPLPEGEPETDDRTGRKRRVHVLAVAIVAIFLGFGLIAYLWPILSGAIISFRGVR